MYTKKTSIPVEKLSREQSTYIMNEYLRSSASRSHICRFMVLYLIHQAGGTMTRFDLYNAFIDSNEIEGRFVQKAKARIGKQIEASASTGFIKRIRDAEEPTFQITTRGVLMVINGIQSRSALLTCDPRLSCFEVMKLVCEEESSSHNTSSETDDGVLPHPKPGSLATTQGNPFQALALVMSAWSTSFS